MKLSQLKSSELQKLVKLISERDAVTAKLAEIESQIDAFSGAPVQVVAKRGRPARSKKAAGAALTKIKVGVKAMVGRRGPKKGEKPGKLKKAILQALEGAGREGLSVRELSDKLKVKTNNIYSWFYTTGRKISKIKKSGTGKYSYLA